ncbi:PEGA domain-containing protein [Patescibacteria group bacterium]|nr:PEGA domain-containing protein [Patescibacteria group bacterium]MBU2219569.1 PEGA domain-containing protein [Patescibacteria group bacterium]MBU2264898.1 PEGA domain-containing protein [Patescibacteria group bacterium]
MTRTTRRVVFYSFFLIFILATPPTILYARGYSFDWQTKSLVQTGGFYLKSLPTNANILINGKNRKNTPRLISRLAPKSYTVTVAKDGFSTWQKNLEIKPQLVTEARNIILFPKNIAPEKVSENATSTISDFLTSPQDRLLYQQTQDLASSSAGWLNRGSDIFYLDSASYILYRRDWSGFIKEQLSREPLSQNAYTLFASSNNRFLALNNQNNLYLLNNNSGIFELIYGQVKDAKFSGDNKKILIRTASELWILYLEDVLIQPYKKAGDKELITRFSQSISQAIFYPDNEHLAFVVGDQIKITELDGRDQRNTIDFVSAPNPQIHFDQASSYFYYLTQNELFRIKLDL